PASKEHDNQAPPAERLLSLAPALFDRQHVGERDEEKERLPQKHRRAVNDLREHTDEKLGACIAKGAEKAKPPEAVGLAPQRLQGQAVEERVDAFKKKRPSHQQSLESPVALAERHQKPQQRPPRQGA